MTDMLVKLYQLPAVQTALEKTEQAGILIRRIMPYEKRRLYTWVKNNFSDQWAEESNSSFNQQPVSCFIGLEQGQFAGFACYNSTMKNFFGPMGVLESYRGKGVGKALLLKSLHAQSEQGYGYAIIGSVGENESYYVRTVQAIPIPGSTPGIYPSVIKS